MTGGKSGGKASNSAAKSGQSYVIDHSFLIPTFSSGDLL